VDIATAPKKKDSWHYPQHDSWPIYRSIPSFSPEPAIEAVGVKQPSVNSRVLGLPGPYHQHVIGTFNTYSRGPTHRSLTNIGGGYNLEGDGFPLTTLRPSQSMVFTFQFNQDLQKVSKFKFKKPMAATWSLDHSVIYHNLHLCLAISNDLSLGIGSTRIDQKVNLMQLGYQSNSYNLMHNKKL
jgi:hypothetical protein